MKTIYLKQIKKFDFLNDYYYKVVELPDGSSETIEVCDDTLSISNDDDFYSQIAFIKAKLCEGNCSEVTRDEFDGFYKRVVTKINQLSVI